LVPLLRAVVAWTIRAGYRLLPHLSSPSVAPTAEVTQLSSFDRTSALSESKAKRTLAAQERPGAAMELRSSRRGWPSTRRSRRRSLRPRPRRRRGGPQQPPASASLDRKDHQRRFQPARAGGGHVGAAGRLVRVALPPELVNSDSGASGLFQFHAGTWSGTPWASQSPFDPVANANAAAWLYSHYGPAGGLVSRGSNSPHRRYAAELPAGRGALFSSRHPLGPPRRSARSGRSAGWGDPSLVFRLYGDCS